MSELSKYTDDELYSELSRRKKERSLALIHHYYVVFHKYDAPAKRFEKHELEFARAWSIQRLAELSGLPETDFHADERLTGYAVFHKSEMWASAMVDAFTEQDFPVGRLD